MRIQTSHTDRVFDRRTAFALSAIVLLAVVLRLTYALAKDDSQGYVVQVVANADIAHHLRSGDGYNTAVSDELSRAADSRHRRLSGTQTCGLTRPARRDRPSPYYLGPPFLVALRWRVWFAG